MSTNLIKHHHEMMYKTRIEDTISILSFYGFDLLKNNNLSKHKTYNFYYRQINDSVGILFAHYCALNKNGTSNHKYEFQGFDLFVYKSKSADEALRAWIIGGESTLIIDIIAFKVENPMQVKILECLLEEKLEDEDSIQLRYSIFLEEANRYKDFANNVQWLKNFKNTHSWRIIEEEKK